jgi:hypothetical protein
VREQVANEHSVGGKRQAREPLTHGVRHAHTPVLRQKQNRRRGELLGQRRETEVGRGRRGDSRLEIRKPIGEPQNRNPAVQDGDAGAGHVTLVGAHEVIDPPHR